uniref:Uncharacterized protein n=1 Tax=Zea mays TaxID=4577 RepID=A0A804PT08_MAIZE
MAVDLLCPLAVPSLLPKPAPSPTTSPWPSSSSALPPSFFFPLVQQQEAPARGLGVQLRCAAVPIQNSGPGSPPHCVIHRICAAPTSTPFTSERTPCFAWRRQAARRSSMS